MFSHPFDHREFTVDMATPQSGHMLLLSFLPSKHHFHSVKIAPAITSTFQPGRELGAGEGEVQDLELDYPPHWFEGWEMNLRLTIIFIHSKHYNYGTSREQILGQYSSFSITEHILDFPMPSTVLVHIRNHYT